MEFLVSIDLFSNSSSSDSTRAGDTSCMTLPGGTSDTDEGGGVRGVGEDEGGSDVIGSAGDEGGWEGAEGVSGLTLGRKAELMSPIPTKKSSTRAGYVNACAYTGRYQRT